MTTEGNSHGASADADLDQDMPYTMLGALTREVVQDEDSWQISSRADRQKMLKAEAKLHKLVVEELLKEQPDRVLSLASSSWPLMLQEVELGEDEAERQQQEIAALHERQRRAAQDEQPPPTQAQEEEPPQTLAEEEEQQQPLNLAAEQRRRDLQHQIRRMQVAQAQQMYQYNANTLSNAANGFRF